MRLARVGEGRSLEGGFQDCACIRRWCFFDERTVGRVPYFRSCFVQSFELSSKKKGGQSGLHSAFSNAVRGGVPASALCTQLIRSNIAANSASISENDLQTMFKYNDSHR